MPRFAPAAALCLLVAAPLHAEDKLSVAAPGVTVEIGLPAFSRTTGHRDWSKAGTGVTGAPNLIYELIPADESFEGWTTLFAVLIEQDLDLTFEAYTQQLHATYARACSPAPEITVLGRDGDRAIDLTIVCPAYANAPNTGEVALFALRRDGDDFARAYQHWRLPAADLALPAPASVAAGIAQFRRIAAGMKISQND